MTARQRWTMVAVILGSAIVFLDSSVVNLALPRIGEELLSSLLRGSKLSPTLPTDTSSLSPPS